MIGDPKSPYSIELVSGDYLDLDKPELGAINLNVIATSLARANRYVGHTSVAYTVAEHAVLVASKLAAEGHDAHAQLLGLHHDSPEAFVGDQSRPYKKLIAALADRDVMKEVEVWLEHALLRALHIPPGSTEQRTAVKAADDWACACEAWHLLPSKGVGWAPAEYDPCAPRHPQMVPCGLPESLARLYFVERHKRLECEFRGDA